MQDEQTSILNVLFNSSFKINEEDFPQTYNLQFLKNGPYSFSYLNKVFIKSSSSKEELFYTKCYGAILYLISTQPEKIDCEIPNLLYQIKDRSIYKDIQNFVGKEEILEILNFK